MKTIMIALTALAMGASLHAQTVKHKPAKKSKIKVTTDTPNTNPRAPYLGQKSPSNDGVNANKERNINYQNNGVQLPSSDGKMMR